MSVSAPPELRTSLLRVGYTEQELAAALRVDLPLEAEAVRANTRRLSDPGLAALVALFFGGEAVPRARLRGVLDVDAAVSAGLLAGDAEVTAPFALAHWDGLYVAHDRDTDIASDHVAGISNATRTLAALTVRRPCRRALDVGTGCGSQALLAARHSEHVVATDVNDRALHAAELNLALNGVQNVELQAGSLFEPVAGEHFDLIVCNPPFVVSPDNDVVFRDAGLERDEISRLVIEGAASHLVEGGYASMLISWAHAAEEDWAETVRAWLSGAGCDAWLVRYVTEDPLEYALKWGGVAAAERWLDYHRRYDITWLTTGGLVLRRRAGGANWFSASDAATGPSGSASAQIERVFAAQGFTGDLLEERLAAAPHRLTEQLAWVGGGYRHEMLSAQLEEGVGVSVDVDPAALPALFALDGSRRVRDLPGAEAALPSLQRLFGTGFVERGMGDRGFEPRTSALSERRSNQLS